MEKAVRKPEQVLVILNGTVLGAEHEKCVAAMLRGLAVSTGGYRPIGGLTDELVWSERRAVFEFEDPLFHPYTFATRVRQYLSEWVEVCEYDPSRAQP